MKQKVVQYITNQRLFAFTDKVLVALSGGGDSVALLRVLLDAGCFCVAAHCNFHLRGEESNRDEMFVRGLCDRLGVKLYVAHFRTEEYARSHGLSIEMAARELRYGWFEQIRMQIGAAVVAVAHHRDDSVETFLLNLIRGTGINGLKGIAPKNGNVVRPLLEVSRVDILDYLQRLGQDYVTDSTNMEDAYTRNKLRLNIIPLLSEINPSISETISETARRLSEVEAVYRLAIKRACQRVLDEQGVVRCSKLMAEVAPQAVLFELFHPLGFNSAQLKDIFRCLKCGESGRLFCSGTAQLLLDRDRLLIRPVDSCKENGTVQLCREIIVVEDCFVVPHDVHVAFLDADLVMEPLELRVWRSGDKFVPFGMKSFKKVRDYLRDRKFSLFDKERLRVVCDSVGEIVWVVNERVDNRFRVTERTRRVLKLWVEN